MTPRLLCTVQSWPLYSSCSDSTSPSWDWGRSVLCVAGARSQSAISRPDGKTTFCCSPGLLAPAVTKWDCRQALWKQICVHW